MIRYLVECKPSPIHGKGVFAKEWIQRGSLVINWLADQDTRLISEQEHLELVEKDSHAARSSVRLIGGIFIIGSGEDSSDFINHHPVPNLIYHQGMCFARESIKIGEELTLDYGFLNSEHQEDVVWGYDPEKAISMSSLQMKHLEHVRGIHL